MHLTHDRRSAARFRGVAAGAVSATLALAAHGGAGGALPASTGLLLLLATSAIVAVLGCCVPVLGRRRSGLFALLGGGQLAGHGALAVASHQHGAPSTAMIAAHAVAVVFCASIIALAERIGPHCAAVLRRVLPRLTVPVLAGPVRPVPTRRVERAAPHRALLAMSISRRGPPLLV